MINTIFARAANGTIGYKNDLPWDIPADLKYFKEKTSGHPIVMGLNTLISILLRVGKPLPNRVHFVLTSKSIPDVEEAIKEALQDKHPNFNLREFSDKIIFCRNLESAIERANSLDQEVFVIGGAGVIIQAMPYVDRIYITEILQHFEGDVFCPPINTKEWSRSAKPENNVVHEYDSIKFVFAEYSKNKSNP